MQQHQQQQHHQQSETVPKMDLKDDVIVVEECSTGNVSPQHTTPPDTSDSSSSGGGGEALRSCLSRRTSSVASTKKRVVLNADQTEIIETTDAPSDDLLQHPSARGVCTSMDTHLDDDEVFSDSISPQLPRGDMCTPYPKKKSSIPGLMYLPDWFGDDRLI